MRRNLRLPELALAVALVLTACVFFGLGWWREGAPASLLALVVLIVWAAGLIVDRFEQTPVTLTLPDNITDDLYGRNQP